jgi:hypothetical protein
MEIKLCMLDIYNDILATEVVPQSWHRTKVAPVVKPGKDSLLSGSYRPIRLLACGRKLIEKMICTHLWTFGQKRMAYCLLLSMVLEKKIVRAIVWQCCRPSFSV